MMELHEDIFPTDRSFFATLAARRGYVAAATTSLEQHAEFRRDLRIWDTISPTQLQQEHAWVYTNGGLPERLRLADCLDVFWRPWTLNEYVEGAQRKMEASVMHTDNPETALWKLCGVWCGKRLASKSGHKGIYRPFNELKIGDYVYIDGLRQRLELSQKLAIVLAFDVSKGRWSVAVDPGRTVCVSVNSVNLMRVVTMEEAAQIRAEIATAQKR
ncbi:hypothetical protein HDU98_010256 [Podochytrium sp. JEL0797]|nr:hypothetical protein HDU98_010238 [Podochytrium sp. JEL0797]KAJ3076980.1 hypothetical protein HDU98_010256 [Podochytrium sp. JEL0797]